MGGIHKALFAKKHVLRIRKSVLLRQLVREQFGECSRKFLLRESDPEISRIRKHFSFFASAIRKNGLLRATSSRKGRNVFSHKDFGTGLERFRKWVCSFCHCA